MKKITILCDRCGKEIKGYPLKLTCDYINRIDDKEVYQAMPRSLKNLMLGEIERDYCEGCMVEIMEFAHVNMDAATFLEDRDTAGKEKPDTDVALSPDTGTAAGKKAPGIGKRKKRRK